MFFDRFFDRQHLVRSSTSRSPDPPYGRQSPAEEGNRTVADREAA
jgi:hypothetical protein